MITTIILSLACAIALRTVAPTLTAIGATIEEIFDR